MRRLHSLRDTLTRQSSTTGSGKRAAETTSAHDATAAAVAADALPTTTETKRAAREHRRQQRRRLRSMGKSERDESDANGGSPRHQQPQPRGRNVPVLVRSLSKDIDLDEQRRLADEQQCDKNEDGDGDEDKRLMKTDGGNFEEEDTENAVIMPPVRIRSVGHTTSEGSTGHANEDRFLVRSGDAFHLFAVMDGHGGHKAADFLVDKLFGTLESVYTQHGGFANKFELERAIEALDKTFLAGAAREMDDSGACFNAVVLYWDKEAQCHQRMVLNCGDCRSIAREAPERPAGSKRKGINSSRSSSWHCNDDRTSTPVISLSEDHSVSNRSEKLRVLEAGAFIRNRRIAGILEPFRSIGDLDMKGKSMRGWVIPTPEIREDELLVGRTTIVVASDGVWSVLSNQRTMMVAQQELSDGGDAQTAAEAIADEAREIGSSDDITVIVVSV